MKRYIIISVILVLTAVSCENATIEKPKILIKEKKMIEMITDIHLAESTFNNQRSRDTLVQKSSSVNFYHSILEKYQVPDSVFESSFIFYASSPKKFEKMYRQVTNKLSEMEQEFSGRNDELLDIGNLKNQRK